MPVQSLNEFADGPGGVGSAVCSQMESSRSTRAMRRRNNISQKTLQETFLLQAEEAVTFECMFCDASYKHNEELGKHVLTKHRPTLCEPTVLCVEAEYLSPLDKRRKSAVSPEKDIKNGNEGSDCEVCGQNFMDSADLETHMKKHKDSFTYACDICGRRFKEPWFLKNHKRTHFSRSGGKNKLQPAPESPVTINEIVQEQVPTNVTSCYKMCMVCGFFFPDKETLFDHSKMHVKGSKSTLKCTNPSESSKENVKNLAAEKVSKEEFFGFLNLKPSTPTTKIDTSSKRIEALDPFNTYQAWQLATKGKVALGHGQLKEPLFEISMETDTSDKDELYETWSTGKISQSAHAEEADSVKDNDGEMAASSQQSDNLKPYCSNLPYTECEDKLQNHQKKSTFCNDCGTLFKTCQQLTMHSRVHSKGRSDSESSTVSSSCEGLLSVGSPDTPASLEDHDANKLLDASESEGEAVLTDKYEDGETSSKTKCLPTSRECSYCGKTFRSNYYLNIHLRTHTGEKPYKCEFCDYAAAQKTSLRYHLERHHKFKPGESNALVKSISKSLQLKKFPLPSLTAPELDRKPSMETMNDTKMNCSRVKPPKRMSALRNQLVNAKQFLKSKGMTLVKNKPEKAEPKEEQAVLNNHHMLIEDISLACEETLDQETSASEEQASLEHNKDITPSKPDSSLDESVPLDLSLKPAQDFSSTICNRALLAIHTCPYCSCKTLYPEVLAMHQKLIHKQNCEVPKNGCRNKNPGYITKMRRTGCPPALKGVDVSPINSNDIRMKVPPESHPKTPNNDQPKLTSVLPNKGVNSLPAYNYVEQENKSHSIHQNGQYMVRYLQPDLQGISHLLQRMQEPEQNIAAQRESSSRHHSGTNGYWSGANQCKRPGTAQLELGEPFSKMTKHNMAISASINYPNVDMVKRHYPSQGYIHNHDKPSSISGNSLLPTNMCHPHEVDPRWHLMKSYEHSPAGTLYRMSNPSFNQGSTSMDSSMEVNHASLYHRVLKRDVDQMKSP